MIETLRRPSSSLCLTLALAVPLACTSKDEGEPAKADAAEAAADKDKAEGKEVAKAEGEAPVKPATMVPTGLSKAVAEGLADTGAGRLDRGNALGHFMVPNASVLLEQVRTRATPAKQSAFLNEAMLRSLAGMQLGDRSAVAQHIALDKPMGCVMLDESTIELPIACVVGYTGGVEAVITDLGDKGKQADAGGHGAHYRVEGEDVFIDELSGQVVITNNAAVFEKAKDYLGRNLIARADKVEDHVEFIAYPAAAMVRYADEVSSFMSLMSSAPPAATGNAFADAMASYSTASTDRALQYYRELDQFELGAGFDEVGFVFRYAAFPTAGSSAQADMAGMLSSPIDPKFVSAQPAQTWLVSAYSIDTTKVWNADSAEAMRTALIDAYAKEIGRTGDEVRTSIENFFTERSKIYGNDAVFSVMHLPGTQGGMVITQALKAPGRDMWKSWSDDFSAETVLGTEGSQYVTWSFSQGVAEVEGLAVDRWTVELGPKAKAEIAKKPDPALAEIERRFGGLKIDIDRVELDDRAIYVVAPGASEQYLSSAIAAAKGGATIADNPGYDTVIGRSKHPATVMAVDGAKMLAWVREIAPPDATRKIPPGLGTDLSDFYAVFDATGTSGVQRGEFGFSQKLIDQLRALAD